MLIVAALATVPAADAWLLRLNPAWHALVIASVASASALVTALPSAPIEQREAERQARPGRRAA